MRRPSVFLFLVISAACLVAPASGSAATSSCGWVQGHFITRVRATNTSCATARATARTWFHKVTGAGGNPTGTVTVNGYRCRGRAAAGTNSEVVYASCTGVGHLSRRITWRASP